MRQLTGWAKDLRVTADGDDVVAMVGVISLRMLADRTGLTQGISMVLTRPGFHPVHDRGRVLTDIACSIAAGGVDVYDIEALRAQADVFGPVASDTTALRALATPAPAGGLLARADHHDQAPPSLILGNLDRLDDGPLQPQHPM